MVRLEDVVEVLAPSLLAALRDVAALGVPAAALLDVQERLAKATDEIASLFADFVLQNLYRPGDDAPAHDLLELGELVEGMRPLAVRATVTNLGRSLSRQVERTLAETVEPARRGRRRR